MHGLPHVILFMLSSSHGFSAYHCSHACMISLFLSYAPRSYYMYYCAMLPLLIWIFPLLDMRAVDMRYVESYIDCDIVPVIVFPLYCSRFPLYCSMLSTELWSSYHVTRIMYCMRSCYSVYLTYQIIKLTWVWGRLDG